MRIPDFINGRSLVYGLLAVIMLAFLVQYSYSAQPQKAALQAGPTIEESLGEGCAASPDGLHVARVMKHGQAWKVEVEGRPSSAEYEEIKDCAFSPDGGRLAFVAKRDKALLVVLDGQELPGAYRLIGPLVFSADGQRLAYAALHEYKWTMVVDGKEGVKFSHTQLSSGWTQLGPAVFSANSRRVAYVGWAVGSISILDVVIVDQIEYPPYEQATFPVFSPDSKRFAFAKVDCGFVRRCGGSEKKARIITDGPIEPDFEEVEEPAFSPDGQRLAYGAKRAKDDWVVILGGEAGPSFHGIMSGPAFSPDGQHLAYVAWKDNKNLEIFDHKVVRELPSTSRGNFAYALTFSPDGQRLAYVLGHAGILRMSGIGKRAKRSVILDGQLGKEYDCRTLDSLTFSPDGKHLAYVVRDFGQKKEVVVLDGQEGKLYDAVVQGSLAFSGNEALKYIAQTGARYIRVTQQASAFPAGGK